MSILFLRLRRILYCIFDQFDPRIETIVLAIVSDIGIGRGDPVARDRDRSKDNGTWHVGYGYEVRLGGAQHFGIIRGGALEVNRHVLHIDSTEVIASVQLDRSIDGFDNSTDSISQRP